MKKNTLNLALLIFTPLFGQVMINEYSASNLSWYTDNYQMEEDWIELYNTGSTAEDIGGYFLSDDSDEPGGLGDVSQDGATDVLDIIQSINLILGSTPSPYQPWSADINMDGLIDILDIVLLINLILAS